MISVLTIGAHIMATMIRPTGALTLEDLKVESFVTTPEDAITAVQGTATCGAQMSTATCGMTCGSGTCDGIGPTGCCPRDTSCCGSCC